jgi:serine/threonine protein kinase
MATVESLGKYEIKRQLGRGAMGTVYEGWDPIIERRVAIKTVNLPDASDPETEEALARFRREAQAAGRLTHPNIVGVFDYGETGDVAYIVMEYIDGPPLKNLLDKQERFTIANTVRIMDDLLGGLQFSHDRGVVHRDIKPANLMLTSGGQTKIADFGIARIESSSMTQAGTVLGTPAYMSPEQIMGLVVDARSDIYSSGVLLYQLLTGERPFEGGMSAIMHKALNTEPPLPSQISVTSPGAFDAVVRKAMAKRPEDRFANAAEFAAAVRDAAEGRPMAGDDPYLGATRAASPRSAARPTPSPTPTSVTPIAAATKQTPPPAKKSALVPIVGAVVAVLLIAGGGAYYFLLRPSDSGKTVVVINPPQPIPPSAPIPNPPVPTPVPPGPQVPPQPPPQPVVEPSPVPPVVPSQPVVQPVLLPPPDPTSAASLDALRAQIVQLVSAQRCVAIDGDVGPSGAATLKGAAAPPAPEVLRNGLARMTVPGGINWQVASVDPLYCPTLDIMQPIMLGFGTKGSGLALNLADGRTMLRDGDRIRPRLVMADLKGPLRVDYVAHDGNVQHLYPQISDTKLNVTADPLSRAFAAGEAVSLGEVGPGHPAWEVGEPYGVDMIIAIQSAQPLFDRPRPSNVETVAEYLRDLRTAVESARHRGVRVIGNVLMVDTVAK